MTAVGRRCSPDGLACSHPTHDRHEVRIEAIIFTRCADLLLQMSMCISPHLDRQSDLCGQSGSEPLESENFQGPSGLQARILRQSLTGAEVQLAESSSLYPGPSAAHMSDICFW